MDGTELTPYEVGRFVVEPGLRPYLFRVKLDPEALTAVGVLEGIAHVFAGEGVPILQVKLSAPRRGEPLVLILVADLRGREGLAGELSKRIGSLRYVQGVSWIPPVSDGVAVDTFSFPLTFRGRRAVIFRDIVYGSIIKEGWRRFGTAYAILLYVIGYEAGRRAYEEHVKLVPEPQTRRLFEALFQCLGYGRIALAHLDDSGREAVVRVYDSFECELFRGVGEIRGNFVRGLIAGWLAGHWQLGEGEEAFAREVKCIAKGDPYCEYVVRAERRG